jgi:predicted nucleotidyltransferase
MSKILAETFTDTQISGALYTRRAERNLLLQHLTSLLEDDGRIAAAWIFGPVGRGDEDDLSDLDIRVIVRDEHIDALCAERQAYASQVGDAVLFQEAPQNRPPGGAFLLTLYEGQFGPQEVDWTWQPLTGAYLWPQTRILLNRAGLTQVGEWPWGYQPVPEVSPLERLMSSVNSFWGMLLVVAKYAARSPYEEWMGLLWMAVEPLRDVSEYLGLASKYTMESLPAHGQPSEKLSLLRDIADQMTGLMPAVEARGGQIPWAVLPCAQRFFDLTEAVTAE